MQFFYCSLISFLSGISCYAGYSIFGLPGLLIEGFMLIMFTLAWFRWEFYKKEQANKQA